MKNIIIPDFEKFEKLKKEIARQGKARLHILADFDRTLTKAFIRGKSVSSIISKLRNGKYLTKDYAPRAQALFDYYHEIEINPDIPVKEKKNKMKEWWKKHFELLAECGLDKQTIKQATEDMIRDKTLELRQGVKEFLDFLHENNILFIIMSASVGDIIIEFLKKNNCYYNNIHVVANVLEFDKKGRFIGIKDNEIVHVLNKHEIELKNLEFYSELLKRKNIILIGDSLGDLGMIEGFPAENIIKIGFFNYPEKESLELFKKNFDAVLLNDAGFDFINKLVEEIVEKEK